MQATPSIPAAIFTRGYDADNRQSSQSTTDTSWWSRPSSPANTNYAANALNQYTTVNGTAFSYDANGNLTGDGTFVYAYDAENRLTGITQGSTAVASYAYDAQGRRKAKTVGGNSTVFVTDADNREVLEYDGTTGAVKTWYAYGPGSNDVLNQMDVASGTRQTMVPDVQGSIIGTLDSATGAVTRTGYWPFGENTSLASGSFQYTAQRFDAETAGSTSQPSGLYYYRARMYSPTLGRFLQSDPAGYTADGNLYAYVGNDPINRIDPLGLWVIQVGLGVSGKGFASGNLEWGIAVGNSGIALYQTGSIGSGGGENGSLNLAASFSPHGSVADMNNSSAVQVSASGRELGVVGVNASTDLQGNGTYGATVGVGGGTPIAGGITGQWTNTICLVCFSSQSSTTVQQPSATDKNNSASPSTAGWLINLPPLSNGGTPAK